MSRIVASWMLVYIVKKKNPQRHSRLGNFKWWMVPGGSNSTLSLMVMRTHGLLCWTEIPFKVERKWRGNFLDNDHQELQSNVIEKEKTKEFQQEVDLYGETNVEISTSRKNEIIRESLYALVCVRLGQGWHGVKDGRRSVDSTVRFLSVPYRPVAQ